MSIQTYEFIYDEVSTNLRRDRITTYATIGITAIALCILGAVMLAILNLQLWTSEAENQLTITLYLKREVASSRARGLRSEISRWPHVVSATYISKEESWESEKKRIAVGSRLEDFTNPLTDSIRIQTDAAEHLLAVAQKSGCYRRKKGSGANTKRDQFEKECSPESHSLQKSPRHRGHGISNCYDLGHLHDHS